MRKRHTSALKAQIVTQALKEEKSIAQIASENDIHPNQISAWKATALNGLPTLFERDSKAAREQVISNSNEELYAQIGRLTTQVGWLKKMWPRRSVEANACKPRGAIWLQPRRCIVFCAKINRLQKGGGIRATKNIPVQCFSPPAPTRCGRGTSPQITHYRSGCIRKRIFKALHSLLHYRPNFPLSSSSARSSWGRRDRRRLAPCAAGRRRRGRG